MLRYDFKSKNELKTFIKQIKDEVAQAQIELPIKTHALANKAGTWMSQRVRLRTKRSGSSGELAAALKNSVVFRKYGKSFTIGVGNIDDLPPYWAMINFGGFISPKAIPGFWADSPGGKSSLSRKTGEFVYVEGGGDEFGYMKPKKPIKGFHYIAYAYVKMSAYVRSNFRLNNRKK